MKENDIGFVPIVRNNKIIGVITDRDIAVKIVSNGDFNADISNYMSKEVISVPIDCGVSDVLEVMRKNRIKRVLVHDKKKIVGVVSISDIINNDVDNILETIKSIWSIDTNKHFYDTDVDDFYL